MRKLLLPFIVVFTGLLTVTSYSIAAGQQYQSDYDDDYSEGYYDDQNEQYNDNYDQTSYQTFYDELSPYGRWINDPQYGYIWAPNAGRDFRPYYSNGYWSYTNYGWTWVSNYSWGWAPFHYGRWRQDPYYGWVWIPGRVWGPAWVSWRHSEGYYGWAPLSPGININISFNIPAAHWVFLPGRYICDRSWYRYHIPFGRNNYYYGRTTIINNTYVVNRNVYVRGPQIREVNRYVRRPIRTTVVRGTSRPGVASNNGRRLAIYRPNIANNAREANRPAPRQYYNRGNNRAVVSNNSRPVRNSVADSRSTNNGRISSPSPNNSRATRTNIPGRSRVQANNDRSAINRRPDDPMMRSGRPVNRSTSPDVNRNNSRNTQPAERSVRRETPQRRSAPQPAARSQQRAEVQRAAPQRQSRPQVQRTAPQRQSSPQVQRTAPQRQSSPRVQRSAPQRQSSPARSSNGSSSRSSRGESHRRG